MTFMKSARLGPVFAILAGIFMAGCFQIPAVQVQSPPGKTTTIVLFRHAEKKSEGFSMGPKVSRRHGRMGR